MPHVIIKLQTGRSEQQKAKIAEEVTKAIMSGANCTEAAVSICIEDINADDWVEKVYKPDIIQKRFCAYERSTRPLTERYRCGRSYNFHTVSGVFSPDKVSERIVKIVSSHL